MTTGNTPDIAQLIDQRPLSGLQIYLVIACSFVMLVDGYDLQIMALTVPAIAEEWSLARSSFGYVLSAAVLGLGLGAAFVGPLGDRWGRRPLLMTSLVVAGIASIGTGLSGRLGELLWWRLLTGISLGTCLPNASALISDYMPRRNRAALFTLTGCNIAVGAVLSGFIVPPIVERWGWQATFFVGGALPLVLAVVMALTIPESIRFLTTRRPGDRRISAVLKRLAPDVDASTVRPAPEESVQRVSVAELLRRSFRARTLLLWCAFTFNSFVLYMLVSWLPALLRDAQWSPERAVQGAVLIQLGGIVGGLSLSWCIDKSMTIVALVTAYLATIVALCLFLVVPSGFLSWGALLVVIGCGTAGSQLALTALAALLYPSTILATGIGWAIAVARIGAISSPIVGGWLLQSRIPPTQLLPLLAVPVTLCLLSVVILPRVVPQKL